MAGEVSFEAAECFFAAFAFLTFFGDVVLGLLVPGQAGESDGVQRFVRSAVASAVEAFAVGGAGGGLDGADSAQRGEGCFGGESQWVVAGGE